MRMITGACDCHVHVVGPAERFPQVSNRPYTAGPATLDSLIGIAAPVGVKRFVVVQPSFYGNDNSCLLEALKTMGKLARGVAVIEPNAPPPALWQDYLRRGVCGVRVNLYSTVSVAAAPDEADRVLRGWIDCLPREGWHLEVIAPLPVLSRAARTIASSKAPVVIDHYGLPGDILPESSEGRSLLDLAALPHVWIKLSGPYRVLPDSLATRPPIAWLNALLSVAPDRCVWGSDWPHTPPHENQRAAGSQVPYRKLDYAQVLGDFLAALPDTSLAERVLLKNPMRLYGFPSESDK